MSSSEWDIAICGLNCAKCGLFKANKCGGCRGDHARHWSPNCAMLSCASERKHNYCFECASFPCESVRSFANDGQAHHKMTVINLYRMKELGVQAWIGRQPSAVFCPDSSDRGSQR